jgi:hypothetical protein
MQRPATTYGLRPVETLTLPWRQHRFAQLRQCNDTDEQRILGGLGEPSYNCDHRIRASSIARRRSVSGGNSQARNLCLFAKGYGESRKACWQKT